MTPELLLAQLNGLKQGQKELPKLFANKFADMAKAAGLGDETSKNTLVLALNDQTNDMVNGQLMIHLRSQGVDMDYLQASSQTRWKLASYGEVLDILRQPRLVPKVVSRTTEATKKESPQMALVRELVGKDLERGHQRSSDVSQVASGVEESPQRDVWS